ncbi:GNAT family N-acetyltransferase [Cupriavidus basilensis]|uniref:GNAT family N-acetyltransferase n=1 Tax=Cupriavidus basilensis TaxID=68895 RepID=A0ABT6ATJ3_9BURK|nr:GNAT family N-acetyltransferase [Cupriavidus basilensis]MDF3835779.1 GNAT family N-acetyltransferase [Cupriavidus basilensis]
MIELHAFTEKEFIPFSLRSVREYATNMTRSGDWDAAAALSDATDLFQRLLPAGLHTPGHHFFAIRNQATSEFLGDAWILMDRLQKSAFIYDLHILPHRRNQGHASHALHAIETFARAQGLSVIQLHVFGHNQAAQKLYGKLGFTASRITMVKNL